MFIHKVPADQANVIRIPLQGLSYFLNIAYAPMLPHKHEQCFLAIRQLGAHMALNPRAVFSKLRPVPGKQHRKRIGLNDKFRPAKRTRLHLANHSRDTRSLAFRNGPLGML